MKKAAILFITVLIYTNLSAQNVGIGINIPTQKLDIVGNIKISGAIMPGGIAGTAGQVLVSNGAGNAPLWDSPVAFMAYQVADANIANNAYGSMSALLEEFDEGNDLNNNIFNAPKNGIYHFEASVKWGTNNSSANYSQLSIEKCDNAGNNCVKIVSSKMNNQVSTQHFVSVTTKLIAGEKIKVFVVQTNIDGISRVMEGKDPVVGNFTDGNITTFFSGHMVR